MAALICLVAAFIVLRLGGIFIPWLSDWQHALRGALGAMFLLTASAHWGRRRTDLVRMVPVGIGNPAVWVTFTGCAEIAIAAGLQIPRLALWTAAAAVVMLCCLFPANAKAAREQLTILRKPVLPFLQRLILQLIYLGALIASVWRR
jgi:uncharacterized membrane protein